MKIKLDENSSISLDYVFNNFTTTILVFGGEQEDAIKAYSMDPCELQRRIGLFMISGVLMYKRLFEVDCECCRVMLAFSSVFSLSREDKKAIKTIYDWYSQCKNHPDEVKNEQ